MEKAMRQHEQCPKNPSHEMPGDVYMIPDKHWKIITSRTDHPGVCIKCNEEQKQVVLYKGTSATNVSKLYQDCYTFVEPEEKNGLSNCTAFSHQPQIIKLHKVKLYYPQRHIGRVAQADFKDMSHVLAIKQAIRNTIKKKSSETGTALSS
jgi:hypothetical protein